MKPHEFSGVYFHLKEWPRPGPTKLSIALSAEGSHREGRLAQFFSLKLMELVYNIFPLIGF